MSHKCQEIEEFFFESEEQDISEERLAAWKEHLAKCKECQTQWAAHQHLRKTLSTLPSPYLSDDFINKVRSKAYQKHAIKAAQGWARFFLRLYWIATTFVTFYLLFRIDWFLPSVEGAWFLYLILIISFASPLLIIRRSRISLFDLVLRLLG